MAGNRIEIMDLKQILLLKKKRYSNRKIAGILQINRNTINAYMRQFESEDWSHDELLKLPDKELSELFSPRSEKYIARFEILASEFEWMSKELTKTGCTLYTLWENYNQKHLNHYGYTQYVHHYNQWAKQVEISGKLEHKSGEKVMMDFTGEKLHYIERATGNKIKVDVYVGILPCSQYTYVEGTLSQKKEEFIGSTERCLHYFGGVPHALQPDNLKSAVTKAHRYEPQLNKMFKDFALHYGCVIDPTRPYSPQDKALVEGAIRIIYRHIHYPLSQMTFFSLEELNKEIRRLLEQYNQQKFYLTSYSRYELFVSTEKDCLQPLPASRYEIRQYRSAKVQKMGYIFLSEDKHYYSVPYRFIGKQVEVSYASQTVEIFYNHERISTHKRNFQPGKYTTHADHLSSAHKAYSQWSLAYFQSQAKTIGIQTEAYITKLILQYPYPEIGYKQAQGILQLPRQYDKVRIENACARTLNAYKVSYRFLETTLKNGMDQLELELPPENHIPAHENIRGALFYQ